MKEVPQPGAPPMTPGGRIRDERSVGELFRDLADETRELLRQEVQLAKAEIGQKVDQAVGGGTSIGVGAAVAFAGVITLCAAASAALFVILELAGVRFAYSSWLAPLIVGVVVAAIGYALVQAGVNTLKKQRLMPTRTAESLRETKEWMQHKAT